VLIRGETWFVALNGLETDAEAIAGTALRLFRPTRNPA